MDNKRPSGGGPVPPAKRQEMEFDEILEEEEDAGWLGPPDEGAEVELGEAGRNWRRPEPAPINPAKDKIRK
jgi:hypothetical protein